MDDVVIETVFENCDILRFSRVELRNFRCFSHYNISLDSPVVIFEGHNGSGKTTLLEALYYSCHLRSFRSPTPRNLIRFGDDAFFVKVHLRREHQQCSSFATSEVVTSHIIQAGFSAQKRIVSVDQRPISSFKELNEYVAMMAVAEHDSVIVQEGPGDRRFFLDYILSICDREYGVILSCFLRILEQRNALIQQKSHSPELLLILTKQLWEKTAEIRRRRIVLMQKLAQGVSKLAIKHFPELPSIELHYAPCIEHGDDFDQFYGYLVSKIHHQEMLRKRSLFGAHLDDMRIMFAQYGSRLYASRGQQKLIILLLKISALSIISAARQSMPPLFLDDFLGDFDDRTAVRVAELLKSIGCQLFFTTPRSSTLLQNAFSDMRPLFVKLE